MTHPAAGPRSTGRAVREIATDLIVGALAFWLSLGVVGHWLDIAGAGAAPLLRNAAPVLLDAGVVWLYLYPISRRRDVLVAATRLTFGLWLVPVPLIGPAIIAVMLGLEPAIAGASLVPGFVACTVLRRLRLSPWLTPGYMLVVCLALASVVSRPPHVSRTASRSSAVYVRDIETFIHLPPEADVLSAERAENIGVYDHLIEVWFSLPPTKTPTEWLHEMIAKNCGAASAPTTSVRGGLTTVSLTMGAKWSYEFSYDAGRRRYRFFASYD